MYLPYLLSKSVSAGKARSLLTFREGRIGLVCVSLGKSSLAAKQGDWNRLELWGFPCRQNTHCNTSESVKSIRISKNHLYTLLDLVKQGPNLISFVKMGKCVYILTSEFFKFSFYFFLLCKSVSKDFLISLLIFCSFGSTSPGSPHFKVWEFDSLFLASTATLKIKGTGHTVLSIEVFPRFYSVCCCILIFSLIRTIFLPCIQTKNNSWLKLLPNRVK